MNSEVEDPNALFADVSERLRDLLTPLQGRERTRPAIDAAMALLDDPVWRKRLDIELRGARYVVKLAQYLLHDNALHAELVRDSGTTVRDEVRTYALETGDFRGERIESPVGLLLDRFAGYRDQADDDVEYESIWQMLTVI